MDDPLDKQGKDNKGTPPEKNVFIMIIGIFLSYAQNVGFDVRKKMYKLPEKGEGR